MWTPVYYVRYVDLPALIDGVTIPNDDGSFDIYINAVLCSEKQEATLQHELAHIQENHFYDDLKPVSQIERLADYMIGRDLELSEELCPDCRASGM